MAFTIQTDLIASQRVAVRRRIPAERPMARVAMCFVLAFFFVVSAQGQTIPPAAKPVPAIEHAVIISIDGLRPDLLIRAKTPNIHAMMEQGTFTFWAYTIPMAVTLPSHVSMITGVGVEKHGIDFNSDRHALMYPNVPTLFEDAHQAKLTTAMAAGKSKFATLNKPGTLDWCYIGKDGDLGVAEQAVGFIREHSPNILFVHFPDNDAVGHAKGWGSLDQVRTIETVDKYVGMIRAALDEKSLSQSTVIILTADHGGAGRNHGPDDPRSRHIPWIVVGPGIAANNDLTQIATLNVKTEDTFATVCWLLAIPVPNAIDGKPIREILAPAK